MKKILVVFGTRPEAIKMCPLVNVLKSNGAFDVKVCTTGQHKNMLRPVLKHFAVVPDYDLEIMKEKQTLFDITSAIILRIKEVIETERPSVVLVHGDTSTAFASALACFYLGVDVGHVEAGLRTYNLRAPFPEEFNRQAIGIVSKFNFAPTPVAAKNLMKEGKDKSSIYVTGNTAIDALRSTVLADYTHPVIDWVGDSRLILVTAHRRENLGAPMRSMFLAMRNLIKEFDDVKIVYPIHMNPAVREIADEVLSGLDRVKLIEPLDVLDFHNIMARAFIILTDSGGIQEEAPSLGIPVLVMRDSTERPEGVRAGTLRLVGTESGRIFAECKRLLVNPKRYGKMAKAKNPYGDGFASERIVKILEGLK